MDASSRQTFRGKRSGPHNFPISSMGCLPSDIGGRRRAWPGLLSALVPPEDGVSRAALDAVPSLVTALADPSVKNRARIAFLLGYLAQRGTDADREGIGKEPFPVPRPPHCQQSGLGIASGSRLPGRAVLRGPREIKTHLADMFKEADASWRAPFSPWAPADSPEWLFRAVARERGQATPANVCPLAFLGARAQNRTAEIE